MSWRLTFAFAAFMLASARVFAIDPSDIKIGMSTPLDAERNGSYVWVRALAQTIEKTGRRVRVYPNSALGGEKERMDQVAIGLLEINETGNDELNRMSPLFHAMQKPFEVDSYAHMDRVLYEAGLVAAVNEELEDDPYVILGFAYTGAMVGLLTRNTPVRRIDDLRPLRLRILSAADINLLNAWGVRGTRVAWEEVAQGLQTGMVDAYLNPPIVAVMFGHANVIDYFTDLRMGPSARVIVASRRWYESLDPAMRAAVDEGVREANRANREWNAAAIARERGLLEKTGIQWLEVSEEARAEWRRLNERMKRSRWESPEAEVRLREMIESTRRDDPDEVRP
jgi:TRAP-type C4-dicarboxylate transport system substrate-binding protein